MMVADLNRSILLTPSGAGAIGVIRVVGPDALAILSKLFRPASRGRWSMPEPQASAWANSRRLKPAAQSCDSFFTGNRLRYGRFVADDEVIDDILVSRAPTTAPPAYDISAHGGIRVIERILQELERHGAPLRDDKETPAPIWPGRNLIDQEAIEALSRAKTHRAVRFLAWQRQHLVAVLEHVASRCSQEPGHARSALEAMLTGYRVARTLIDGATVVILGPPNSGKSTLFNRLLGRSAAIVSPQAGTTRDWVAESVEIDGVPFTLVDTADRRETSKQLERHAMESGRACCARADLCLWLLDGSQPLSKDVRELYAFFDSGPRRVTAVNKIDLGRVWDTKDLLPEPARGGNGNDWVLVSAQTGAGLDRLTRSLLRRLGYDNWVDAAPCFFTPRQRDLAAGMLSDLAHSAVYARSTIRERLIGTEVAGGSLGMA